MDSTTILLQQNGYWQLNYDLVAEFGFSKAAVLTDLIVKFNFFERTNQLIEKKWFFYRREDMSQRWKMQVDAQRKVLKELRDLNLIDFQLRGISPQKQFYTINRVEVDQLLFSLHKKYKNER